MRSIGSILPAIWMLVTSSLAMAQINPDDLLPVEQAFALQAQAQDTAIELTFDIAPGYYLYRHAFRFDSATEGLALGEPGIPPGEASEDEFFGQTETYRDRLVITLPVNRHDGGPASVDIRFQGCADVGVCYPPHRQTIAVQMSVISPAPASGSGLDALLGRSSRSGGLVPGSAGALPAEEAFRYEAIATSDATVLVRMTAAPDYYLYRDSITFHTDDPDVLVEQMLLPEAVAIHDEYFGDTSVYYDEVEIPVYLSRPAGPARRVELTAEFQGCLTDGICYPPMSRSLSVELPQAEHDVEAIASVEASGDVATRPASEQDRLAAALTGTPVLALLLFLLAGVLLAFTPCVFPMVPILSGLIAGEGDRMTTGRAFRLSLVYVLAMALVYTAFGVVAGLFGQNLQALFQHPLVLSSFAALFVVLSLAMFGFYELQLPASVQTRLNAMSNRAEGGTLIGAGIMGALSALVVGPCVAPALMGALIYIGQTGDAVLGGAALFSMAIGMGIPLMVWGTSAGSLLPRAGGWMVAVKAVFGVGLLALAIWMLERVLPGSVIMLLWGSLMIVCGVYLGAFARFSSDTSGWQKLWQGLGVILLVIGVIQLLGALSGGNDWTRPLNHWAGGGRESTAVDRPEFRSVSDLEGLQRVIAAAPGAVFVDFYADWCVDCVRMERRTFPDPEVSRRMAEMTLIKVDVTDYSDEHKAILNHFGLIGPPAYLFFRDGGELSALRTFGFLPPDEFSELLDQASG